MGLFDSPQKKWIKQHASDPWNKMFTGLGQYDVMIAKLMVFESVSFADHILTSGLFSGENLAIRAETILLAKMQFYHLVTKSATVHNLFYGYIHELWLNHYRTDIETANLVLERMHHLEKWYLTWYYDFYSNSSGNFAPVIKEYCKNAKKIKDLDGNSILLCAPEDLQQHAAKLLMDMQITFMTKMKQHS